MGKGRGGKVDKTAPQPAHFQKNFLNESNKSKNWRPVAIFLECLDPPGKKKSELLSPLDFKSVCIYVIKA
jgi:hypothetical protein